MINERGIHLLPPDVADRIAAGEVIERPASVVKELVENSLDAGATRIHVLVRQGGRTLRVADNGSGIPAAELPLAFQRFATSKIRDIDDLWHIQSMGFRGEALASIAAIARVEAFSRPDRQPVGAVIRFAPGQDPWLEERGGPAGTVIEIDDLFYNTPARLKFLRQDVTEVAHVAELLTALALAHPAVAFTLQHEERETFATLGSGQLRDVVRAIYGRELAQDLLPVQQRSAVGFCQGLISTPAQARRDRNRQVLFINRRWVRLPMLGKLLDDVYGDLLGRKHYPVAILSLDLPPDRVDVNVHPTKREVRLQNSQGLFALLHEGLREALYKGLPPQAGAGEPPTVAAELFTPAAGQPASDRQDALEVAAEHAQPAVEALRETATPYAEEPPRLPGTQVGDDNPRSIFPSQGNPAPIPPSTGSRRPPGVLLPLSIAAPPTPKPASAQLLPELHQLRLLGQFAHTYILAEGPQGLYLIDQHAAHERTRYERLLERGAALVTQPLLTPLLLKLTALEVGLLAEHRDVLAEAGFAIEEFGQTTMRVREVPHDFPAGAIENAVRGMVQDLQEHEATLGRSEQLEWLRKSVACQGAVKAGRPLDASEMQELLREWGRTLRPQTCPHGRPVFQVWPVEEINKRFWR